jgi:GNAT superfamily N-acetyltransferase
MTAPHTPPPSARHAVIRAGEPDAAALAEVIAGAFDGLAVSQWLVPDPALRRVIFPVYFLGFPGHALEEGVVYTTPDRGAAALWLPGTGPAAPADGYAAWLAAITGSQLGRFAAFDEALKRHHPAGIFHHHLAILAVRPGRQHQGTGTALLDAYHADLDERDESAYLEAPDAGTRYLYLRHGYQLRPGSPIRLPAGPDMWPMWRTPSPAAASPRTPRPGTGQARRGPA